MSHTVSILPRLQSQTATIKVNLKRKLQYKSSALSLNIRPHKVVQAAKWTNSSLYRDEGIVFDSDWINKYGIEATQCDNDDNDNNLQSQSDENNASSDITGVNLDDNDELNEDEVELSAGVTDTLFTATDFLEDNEWQNILNIAPGEGNRPLSVFRDKYCEKLAYPGIFLGQARPDIKQRKVIVIFVSQN